MNSTPDYKELYQYDEKHSLVIDEISGDVYISKRLTHYDPDVYQFLYTHSDRHIPRIVNLIEEGEELVVIEEYIRGNTFDVILGDASMPDRDKLKYFVDLCEGLMFLHNAPKPIIHRDLKPSNILIADDGRLVIIDYDAAKIFKSDQNQDTTFLGTEGRAAPEQYGFMQSDVRTDIYAVGRMLKDAFPNNKRLQKAADKAMSFDPKDRYESIEAFRNVLIRKVSAKMQLKPLFPPPGFRTGCWYKIPVAVMAYPMMVFFAIGVTADTGSLLDQIFAKVFLALFFFVAVDICCSWTGLFDVLPLTDHSNVLVRALFKVIYIAVAGFVLLVTNLFASGTARIIAGWFR